jgi:hypothetical protein
MLKLEKAIKRRLTGDAQKNALDFAAFLRVNDLSLERGIGFDGWNVYAKKTQIAMLAVDGEKNEFRIVLHVSGYDGPADDDLREFAWAHVVLCPQGCGSPTFCDESRNRRTILGKEYESTCQSPLTFFNLDAEDLEKAEKLILMLK